jgi:hypothetical protein
VPRQLNCDLSDFNMLNAGLGNSEDRTRARSLSQISDRAINFSAQLRRAEFKFRMRVLRTSDGTP